MLTFLCFTAAALCACVPGRAASATAGDAMRPSAVDPGTRVASAAVTAAAAPTPNATVPGGASKAVASALADLRQRLGLAADAAVTVLSVVAKDWPDTGLGCPDPERMYAQVITAGYLIQFKAGGATYEYHTDAGERVVLCEQGRPLLASPH